MSAEENVPISSYVDEMIGDVLDHTRERIAIREISSLIETDASLQSQSGEATNHQNEITAFVSDIVEDTFKSILITNPESLYDRDKSRDLSKINIVGLKSQYETRSNTSIVDDYATDLVDNILQGAVSTGEVHGQAKSAEGKRDCFNVISENTTIFDGNKSVQNQSEMDFSVEQESRSSKDMYIHNLVSGVFSDAMGVLKDSYTAKENNYKTSLSCEDALGDYDGVEVSSELDKSSPSKGHSIAITSSSALSFATSHLGSAAFANSSVGKVCSSVHKTMDTNEEDEEGPDHQADSSMRYSYEKFSPPMISNASSSDYSPRNVHKTHVENVVKHVQFKVDESSETQVYNSNSLGYVRDGQSLSEDPPTSSERNIPSDLQAETQSPDPLASGSSTSLESTDSVAETSGNFLEGELTIPSTSVGNSDSRTATVTVSSASSSAIPQPATASVRKSKRFRKKGRRGKQAREEEDSSTKELVLQEEKTDASDVLCCPVCLDVFYHAFICRPCDHVFCEPCLRRLAKYSEDAGKECTECPICREPIIACVIDYDTTQQVKVFLPDDYIRRHRTEGRNRYMQHPLPSRSFTPRTTMDIARILSLRRQQRADGQRRFGFIQIPVNFARLMTTVAIFILLKAIILIVVMQAYSMFYPADTQGFFEKFKIVHPSTKTGKTQKEFTQVIITSFLCFGITLGIVYNFWKRR